MDVNKLTLGERIRTYRLREGLTQEGLAAAVKVHPVTISRWENDHTSKDISAEQLNCLANILHVSTGDLIEDQVA